MAEMAVSCCSFILLQMLTATLVRLCRSPVDFVLFKSLAAILVQLVLNYEALSPEGLFAWNQLPLTFLNFISSLCLAKALQETSAALSIAYFHALYTLMAVFVSFLYSTADETLVYENYGILGATLTCLLVMVNLTRTVKLASVPMISLDGNFKPKMATYSALKYCALVACFRLLPRLILSGSNLDLMAPMRESIVHLTVAFAFKSAQTALSGAPLFRDSRMFNVSTMAASVAVALLSRWATVSETCISPSTCFIVGGLIVDFWMSIREDTFSLGLKGHPSSGKLRQAWNALTKQQHVLSTLALAATLIIIDIHL